jgi:hypothetical protein
LLFIDNVVLFLFKWELVMPNINMKNIHHVLIYECLLSMNDNVDVSIKECDRNKARRSHCTTISFGWAVGGDLVHYFPKDTG